MKKLCHYISEYMGLLVLAAALLAMVFPHTLAQVPTRIINYLLGLVMFGMGLTLNLNDFKIVFSRPKYVMIGCLAQFTVMPLLAWALARLFQLDDALALGVVLVGCCPGGTASNVITYLAKGDLALSVGMTGVSTLLAPFLTPLLTWALAGKSVDVNVASMFLSILWVVIVPIVVGWLVKWLWPKFTESVTDYLPAFSSMAIAFIVAIIIAANHQKLLVGGLLIIVVVMLHNIFGLGIGYLIGWLCRLSEPRKRAISIEVGMQNSGLASSLATIHFAAYPLATIPGAIFSVWHNISGAAVAYLYRKKGEGRVKINAKNGNLVGVFFAFLFTLLPSCQNNGETKNDKAKVNRSEQIVGVRAKEGFYLSRTMMDGSVSRQWLLSDSLSTYATLEEMKEMATSHQDPLKRLIAFRALLSKYPHEAVDLAISNIEDTTMIVTTTFDCSQTDRVSNVRISMLHNNEYQVSKEDFARVDSALLYSKNISKFDYSYSLYHDLPAKPENENRLRELYKQDCWALVALAKYHKGKEKQEIIQLLSQAGNKDPWNYRDTLKASLHAVAAWPDNAFIPLVKRECQKILYASDKNGCMSAAFRALLAFHSPWCYDNGGKGFV